MSFKVIALTPSGTLFEKEASEAYFPSIEGPIGIFTDYAPGYITLQESGTIRINSQGKDYFYAVFGGIVKVENNIVTILSDDIEDGFDIDMSRAIAARDRANDRIEKNLPDTDIKKAKAALSRALTRINVKTLSSGGK